MHKLVRLGVVALILVMAATAAGQVPAPLQSTWRPYGLNLWHASKGQVMATGSDAASALFNTTELPKHKAYVAANLKETVRFVKPEDASFTTDKIYFFADYAPRIYFIHDGAGLVNTLAVNICAARANTTDQPNPGTPSIVFPIALSNLGIVGNGTTTRDAGHPLVSGDFVQLPLVKKGQQLDLRLYSFKNAYNAATQSYPPYQSYFNRAELNPDELPHMAMFVVPGSNFILLGIEDLVDGDYDMNDLVMAVDLGPDNAKFLTDKQPAIPR